MGYQLLRMRDACAVFGHSKSQHYLQIKAGLIPPPIDIGERGKATPKNEIEAIVEARAAGLTDDEIRRLVKRMLAQRHAKAEALRASLSEAA